MKSFACLAGTLALGTALMLGGVAGAKDPAPNEKKEAAPAPKAQPSKPFEFKREWAYPMQPNQWTNIQRLLGKPAPALTIESWQGEAKDLSALKGKIVVVDFWATWCGPCIQAIPHMNEITKCYRPKGVEVIGVCSTRGGEKMAQVATAKGMEYPTGRDKASQVQGIGVTERAFGAQWWPYIFVIDRQGNIRGAGIQPGKLETVLDALLVEQPNDDPKTTRGGKDSNSPLEQATMVLASYSHDGHDAPASNEKRDWHESPPGDARSQQAKLENAPAKPLQVDSWTNTSALKLEDLKGKVVLLDFWATWCAPCRAAVPHTNKMAETHKEAGLVVIGVCASNGAEKMAEVAKQLKIAYPVAADIDNATVNAYGVNGFPDYYLIDRKGQLRYADIKNGMVEEAVKALLAEK